MRTWQNTLYNLQSEAPKPYPIRCTRPLTFHPEQYDSAYHGPLSRQSTEELLDGKPSGSYLVRDSQRSDGAFTLVIRFDDTTKNYKLYYDTINKLHYVGEKKFNSIDLLVADGLIYLYIETRGADVLQKISEASNYEFSPYYKTRYHAAVNAPPGKFKSTSPPSNGENPAAHPPARNNNRTGVQHRQSVNLDLFRDHLSPTHHHPLLSPLRRTKLSRITPDIDLISAAADLTSYDLASLAHNFSKENSIDSPKNIPPEISIPDAGILRSSPSIVDEFQRLPAVNIELQNSLNSVNGKALNDDTVASLRHASVLAKRSTNTLLRRAVVSTLPACLTELEPKARSSTDSLQLNSSTLSSLNPPDTEGGSPLRNSLTSSPASPSSVLLSGQRLQHNFRTDHKESYLATEKHHNFRVRTFRGPHWCDYCTHFIWGLVSQGVKCSDCGFQAHKRCSVRVPNDCLPDMKMLKRVFGVELSSLVRAERREVPLVLMKCVTELENRGGLRLEGIFRIPGSHEVVENFRIALDKDCENVDLSYENCSDPNTISSLIKCFLRQLPIPLITDEVYPEFIKIIRDDLITEVQRLQLLKIVILKLPVAHFHTLRYLMSHLNRVAANQQWNMMTAANLAIVFTPSLMNSSTSPTGGLEAAKFEQALIERMIVNFAELFFGSLTPPSPRSENSSLDLPEAIRRTDSTFEVHPSGCSPYLPVTSTTSSPLLSTLCDIDRSAICPHPSL